MGDPPDPKGADDLDDREGQNVNSSESEATKVNPVTKSNNPFIDSNDKIIDKALEEGFYPPDAELKEEKLKRKALEAKLAELQKENKGLQEDYETLNLSMGDLKKSIFAKEDIINGLRELIEKQDEETAKLVANNEKALTQKEDEVKASRSDSTAITLIRPENVNDMFKLKPNGKSARNIDINNFKCENESCNMLGVDCIKCSETCHGVPVGKCKPIFNKCKSIYFMCKACEESAYLNKIQIK